MDTFSKGDRISITLTNGTSYEAHVKSYSKAVQRLSLKNIIQQPGNVIIDGVRTFESFEISHVKVFQSSDSPVSVDYDKAFNHKNDDGTFTRKISDAEYDKILLLQNSVCFIDSISKYFHDAVTNLKLNEVIGLCVKDISKGRTERASVIALSTASHIYVFDLETLGDKAFDEGLRGVLQSDAIKKVVYDCRLLSDCLFHKHQIKLDNVRDIEAEDVMIVHQERGYIRKHCRPFGYLIETYLGVPGEPLFETDSSEAWRKRPLNPEYLKLLAIYTSFLIPVQEAMERQFLQRLIKASKIYNEYLRDSDMYVFITEETRLVFRNQLMELVKRKNTCRRI